MIDPERVFAFFADGVVWTVMVCLGLVMLWMLSK